MINELDNKRKYFNNYFLVDIGYSVNKCYLFITYIDKNQNNSISKYNDVS